MDRVRFEDDERLDLPDTKALQSLVYEYLGRALGSLMGRPEYESNVAVGGWLSCEDQGITAVGGQLDAARADPFEYDHDTQTISIKPGQFYTAEFTSSGVTAEILQYNPSATEQDTVSLDVSGFVGSQTPFTIWAYGVDQQTSTENRKFWDAISQTEITGTVATRSIRKMAFFTKAGSNPLSTGLPVGASPFKIGKVASYSPVNKKPILNPIFAFDVKLSEGMTLPSQDSYHLQMMLDEKVNLSNTGFGVFGHMQALRTSIASLYDAKFQQTGSTWLDPSLSSTNVGLVQIEQQLTKIETLLAENGLTEAGEFQTLSDKYVRLNKKMQQLDKLFHNGSLCIRAWARFTKQGNLTDYSAGNFGSKVMKPYGGGGANGAGIEGGNVRVQNGVYSIRFYFYKAGSTGAFGGSGPGFNYKNLDGALFQNQSPFGCAHLSVEHPVSEPLFENFSSNYRQGILHDLGTGEDGIGKYHDFMVTICQASNQMQSDGPFTIVLMGPGKSA